MISQTDSSDEIDLKELWNAIWQGKWLIMAVTGVFAIASVFYALSLPNEYKSTAILAPASQAGGAGGLAKLAGQFGGLASLAGINLGGAGGEDKTVIAMELIKTWGFLEKFIEDNDIAVEVYAAKGWNRATNELIIDPDIYDVENKKWVRDFDSMNGASLSPKDSWLLFEKFRKRISLSENKKTGLVSISVEYYSPILAQKWAQQLVQAINEHIKISDRKNALKSIDYLTKKVSETKLAGLQTVFFQLIEEQHKNLMLAEVSEQYVFQIISPPKVAAVKSKPMKAIIVLVGIVIGGIIAILFVIFSSVRKQ
ncbi:Wzz/FepE/Etk N-terminal domain-containing protein [Aliikangiella sp. IMCC44653]